MWCSSGPNVRARLCAPFPAGGKSRQQSWDGNPLHVHIVRPWPQKNCAIRPSVRMPRNHRTASRRSRLSEYWRARERHVPSGPDAALTNGEPDQHETGPSLKCSSAPASFPAGLHAYSVWTAPLPPRFELAGVAVGLGDGNCTVAQDGRFRAWFAHAGRRIAGRALECGPVFAEPHRGSCAAVGVGHQRGHE